ncbi:hypothetical protein ACFC0P_50760, partial [Streptomyces broussonetiae]
MSGAGQQPRDGADEHARLREKQTEWRPEIVARLRETASSADGSPVIANVRAAAALECLWIVLGQWSDERRPRRPWQPAGRCVRRLLAPGTPADGRSAVKGRGGGFSAVPKRPKGVIDPAAVIASSESSP